MPRRRILVIKSLGYSVIQDICVSKVTIYKLLKKYKEFRTVLDKPRRASLPRKLNADHVKFIDDSGKNSNPGGSNINRNIL